MPEGEKKEDVAESIDSIERNLAYINKIVQDLQDYSRQVVPEYSVADLPDVIVHVFETISVPESINLAINVKDSEKIRIDPTLLQRAITNLVNNAIQAMPDGGKLEICGEKIDTRILVTVSDTGGGIPDEVKPKLFTPMMTTKAKGQGFGLAASKRMIEAMKGTIYFESEKRQRNKIHNRVTDILTHNLKLGHFRILVHEIPSLIQPEKPCNYKYSEPFRVSKDNFQNWCIYP